MKQKEKKHKITIVSFFIIEQNNKKKTHGKKFTGRNCVVKV